MADFADRLSVAKACSTCAKSKAKCDWTSANARCHRCSRLNKECVPQESIRKRKAPRIRRAAQIAQLEEKVNSLLFAAKAGQQLSNRQLSNQLSPLTPSTTASTQSCQSDDYHDPINLSRDPTRLRQPSIRGLPMGLPSILTIEFGLNDPGTSFKDPDALLAIFQDQLASQVPFLIIPRSMTAETLRKEKPLVYMAVMFASSYENLNAQLALGKEILEQVVVRLILRGEKSLDLLQGLLIYLTWYHYCLCMRHQVNNLLALISAHFVDLGLKRISAENEVNEAFLQITKKGQGLASQPKDLTTDEKRALLGCYYLSSCLTSTLSRMDCLRFTPYVEECCDSIAQAGEHETDANLSCLVKLQGLVQKQRLSGLWDSLDAQYSDTPRASFAMVIRSFQMAQVEFQRFKSSLSDDQLFNPFFALHYYSAEIHAYEACFKMSPSTDNGYSLENLRLVNMIYSCFDATKSFFELFLSVPMTSYCTLSIVNIGQMFHALGALYKLSVFDAAGWDVKKVRGTLNFSRVLNQISTFTNRAGDLYGPASSESEERCSENPWIFCSRKLSSLQIWWDVKLAQEADINDPGLDDTLNNDLQALFNFDYFDDSFWN